jgi:alkylated DNA repair protein alkB homolog 6
VRRCGILWKMSLWKKFKEEKKNSSESSVVKTPQQTLLSIPNTSTFIPEIIRLDLNTSWDARGILSEILYYENAFSTKSEAMLMDLIYHEGEQSNAWKQLKTRRLQCWGGMPENDSEMKENGDDAMPPWLNAICDVFVRNGFFPSDFPPNHVLINEYQPGQGIMHHTDGPRYLDRVVILSLGSSTLMSFRPRLSSEEIGNVSVKETSVQSMSLFLKPGSLLYFTDEAYHNYLHGIEARFFDDLSLEENLVNRPILDETVVNREKRISFTIRHLYRSPSENQTT